MKRTILLFFLILSGMLHAQDVPRLLVIGVITSAETNAPIDGALITCKSPARVTQSDKKGHYAVLVDYKTGTVLEFRMYGYETRSEVISSTVLAKAVGDTLHLDIQLKSAPIELPGANITLHKGADTVIGNWHFFIEDFEFYNDTTLVLLTFENSLKKAKVMLADLNEKILASTDVPVEAISLMRDYQGHINVMCKDSAFRVKIVPPEKVLLFALPYSDFCARILPCVDTLGGKIIFSNYHAEYPAFTYYAYDPADTSIEELHYIVDKELLAQYNWEFDYLKPKDRLYARKMEAYTGIDKRIIAATMTGFPQSIYYTPLFAPAFVTHGSLCVFDHYSDTLFLFNSKMEQIGGVKIDYHHPKNWKDWDRAMIKDEVTGEVYAQFENGGTVTLKKIDLETGKIAGEFKITNRYPKQIHIRDGNVYYVYRPFESIQKKYLYKEVISF